MARKIILMKTGSTHPGIRQRFGDFEDWFLQAWTGCDVTVVNAVTAPELPELALISLFEASPHDAATAYVAATRYKHDDFQPYLFKTSDYGQTWAKITHGIPADDFTRVVR